MTSVMAGAKGRDRVALHHDLVDGGLDIDLLAGDIELVAEQVEQRPGVNVNVRSRKPCNPSTTRSARGCHPCLR